MLTALVLSLTTTAAADCMSARDYIIMEDDLMRVSADNADEIEIHVETMITDDRVPFASGEGDVVTVAAADLAEGETRRGFYVFEDNVILRMGSSGVTIDEYAFQIAGMGTEVLVFFLTGDFVYEDDIIFASSAVIGPLESIEGEIPEGAVQLIPTPSCR